MTLQARTRSSFREDRHLAKTASPIKVTMGEVGDYGERKYKCLTDLEYQHRGKQ